MKYWITWTSTPESLDMGGAPPRTDALIGPAACGRCPKTGQLKMTCPCARALSWISELSGTPRSYASRFRNCALQRAPVRWTLALKTNHLWGPGPCQSRNITEQRVETHVRGRAEFSPKKHEPTTWHPKRRTEQRVETHGKTKPNIQPASTTESKYNKLNIPNSDWTGKNWSECRKESLGIFRDLFLVS